MSDRLQKVLSQAGMGSRRGCENLIREGRVTVNGRIATLGMRVDPNDDDIRVDGESIRPSEAKIYIALNKPVGVLSSLKPQGGRETILDVVSIPERIYPVGRLDIDSEGLMLLTNDGELTHHLTHPRFGHEKEYRVLLNRRPDKTQLNAWRRGVVLEDGVKTYPAKCWLEQDQGSPWLRVVLRQGRKRQIRRTARALGLKVVRLIRVRIDALVLGSLEVGAWRRLRREEIQRLKSGYPKEQDHR